MGKTEIKKVFSVSEGKIVRSKIIDSGSHEYLLKNGICATIRREFGSKVKAACGQLRSDFEEGKNE